MTLDNLIPDEWKAGSPPKLATKTTFPFQTDRDMVEGRWATLNLLWQGAILPNWRAFRSSDVANKKQWHAIFIHGYSGVGKTRFSLEFLNLLHEFVSQPEFDADADVCALRSLLEPASATTHTVLLDIRHNGSALNPEEAKWSASVILGLRLAAQCWFPQVAYARIRDILFANPSLAPAFNLLAVLGTLSQHPPVGMSQAPRLLHLAVDEIQTAIGMLVPYEGQNHASPSTREPLSKALNRALMAAISASTNLAVLGTFAGTAQRHDSQVLDPTDSPSMSVLLSPLSPQAVRNIVDSFERRRRGSDEVLWTGRTWQGESFERLLHGIGGNSRALECLEAVLQTYPQVPTSLPLDEVVSALVTSLVKKHNLASWGTQPSAGLMGLLLALAGIPVRRATKLTPANAPEELTVDHLERAGLVQLRMLPQVPLKTQGHRDPVWAAVWQLDSGLGVMDVAHVLALAGLDAILATGMIDDEGA